MADQAAKLSFSNQSIELPVYPAKLGSSVIDVSSVYKYDVFTYDPGFMSTSSCE